MSASRRPRATTIPSSSRSDDDEPRLTRRELGLVERAAREGWAVSGRLRTAMVRKLAALINNEKTRPRELVAAAKVLAALSRTNLAGIETQIRAEEHAELKARVEELEQMLIDRGHTT
jgi:hypothetical protein